MSSITYTALSSLEYPWLLAGDRGLQIDEGTHAGKVIVVNMLRYDNDTDFDGLADTVVISVQARRVNISDGSTMTVGGKPVVTSRHNPSVKTASIDSGDVDLDLWVIDLMDAEVFKCLRLDVGLTSYALLPASTN